MPSPPNRNRRVTDKHDGLLDAAQHAVRMERLEGQQALLTQRVSSGMENVANSLASVQTEVRGFSHKLGELGALQHSHDTSRAAIDEMKKSVTDLNSRLEDWFTDFEQRSQQRWDKFERQRDEWRREHEAENESDKRDLEKEIRNVRETVIRGIGFGSALAALAGVIIGGFLWNINYRFNEGREDLIEVRAHAAKNASAIQMLKDETLDVKLYLSRGGRIPVDPYVPQPQRRTDEARKP